MVLRKLRNHLLDKSGSTVFGAEVYIYTRGTDTLATLYADDAGAIPLANPLITSSLGLWECYLETGRYRRVSIIDSAIMEVDDFELVADLEIGADVQAWDADLDAVAALAGTGISVRTAAATWTVRTIAGTTSQITVTDGDGVAGSPTLSLPASITLGEINERVADAGVVIESVTLKDGGVTFGTRLRGVGADSYISFDGAGSTQPAALVYGMWLKTGVGLAFASANSGNMDWEDGASNVLMSLRSTGLTVADNLNVGSTTDATTSGAGSLITFGGIYSTKRIISDTDIIAMDAIYLGDPDVDGSWRHVESSGDLLIQKRVSGSWVTKSTISGA